MKQLKNAPNFKQSRNFVLCCGKLYLPKMRLLQSVRIFQFSKIGTVTKEILQRALVTGTRNFHYLRILNDAAYLERLKIRNSKLLLENNCWKNLIQRRLPACNISGNSVQTKLNFSQTMYQFKRYNILFLTSK